MLRKKLIQLVTTLALFSAVVSCTDPSVSTPDSTPDPFTFTAHPGAEPGAVVTSDAVTVTGINTEVTATATEGGELIVNGTASGSQAAINNRDTLAVRVTASYVYGDPIVVTVDVGGTTASFTVTTREAVGPTVTLSANSQKATPGETITLTWKVEDGDYNTLEITNTQAGTTENVTELSDLQVEITDEYPGVEFTLIATLTDPPIESSDSLTIDVPLWVCGAPTDSIDFADESLRDNFYAQVGTPSSGPITCADAHALTTWDTRELDGDGEIASLVGMQHFEHLEAFLAPYNQVKDLTPLSNLTKLEQLNLDKNRVQDLTPLASLPALKILELWDNGPVLDENTDGIEIITPIAGITTLEELYLSENFISDLSPLESLTSLRVLYAIGNNLTDITPIANLDNLQVLRISTNFITDASALGQLENLAWLELEYNLLQDPALTPLSDFTDLFVVKLEGNYFTDLSPLVDNTSFPAAHGAPDLPAHRQQPEDAEIAFAWNCLSEADNDAAGNAFIAKGLVVDSPRIMKPSEACDAVLTPEAAFERQQEILDMFREEGKIR